MNLLDNDLYKFHMMHYVFHTDNPIVKYEFINRGLQDISKIYDELLIWLDRSNGSTFTSDDIDFLQSLGHYSEAFLEYLKTFKWKSEYIKVSKDMTITIEGPWLETILFEVPLLSMINELFFKGSPDNKKYKILDKNLGIMDKYSLPVMEFGTRRRFSSQWQKTIVNRMTPMDSFLGTSNVLLAKETMTIPLGTMAHEYLSYFQSICHPLDSQFLALSEWLSFYNGTLGIALSDIFGEDKFFEDFNYNLSMNYSGVRHDSGDPYAFATRLIDHYKSMGIDPKDKQLIFSDGLTMFESSNLYTKFKDEIQVSFGIGTSLTNNLGIEPLKIVIKLIEVSGRPVAKMADGKCIGDKNYVKYLRSIL